MCGWKFRSLRRISRLLFLASLLLFLLACKQVPPPAAAPHPLDRMDSKRLKPVNFLHKTFVIKKSVQFKFEVPPHSVLPRLQGTFQSFVTRPGADNLSDEIADVELLLMNADQFADFSHGRGDGTALYNVDPTHNHEVEFLLPPRQDHPAHYYVIFRNAPGGAPVKSVQADFSLNFGYQ